MSTEYNREINNTLVVDSYIGESHQEQFNEFCNRDFKTLLLSGDTGIGKTIAIINYAKQHPNLKISLLCPMQTLVNNLALYSDVACGYGEAFYRQHRDTNFVVTTYDTGLMFKDRDLEVIDESHLLPSHSDFREVIIRLLSRDTKKIFLTATPEIIIDLPYFSNQDSMIAFDSNKGVKDVKILNTRKRSKTIIAEIIEGSKDAKETILIRVNSKDVILDAVAHYHNTFEGRKIGYLYSSNSEESKYLTEYQSEETLSNLKKGVIKGLDVVLVTSILDVGITLDVDRNIQAYSVSNDNRKMPHPIDAGVQIIDRIRKGSEFTMSLSIIGSFGNYEDLRTPIPNYSSINQTCKLMSTNYEQLSNLREQDYLALLSKYKLNPIVVESLGFDELQVSLSVSKTSEYTMMTNFTNYPAYSDVCNTLINKGNEEQIKIINGTKSINGDKEDIRSKKASRTLIYCVDKNIHLSLVLNNNKYNNKAYNVLKNVVDNYTTSTSDTFSNLVRGISYNADSTFNFKELDLDKLIKSEAQTIKYLFDMIYKRGNFRGKSAKKVFKEGVTEDSEIVKYLNLLTNK